MDPKQLEFSLSSDRRRAPRLVVSTGAASSSACLGGRVSFAKPLASSSTHKKRVRIHKHAVFASLTMAAGSSSGAAAAADSASAAAAAAAPGAAGAPMPAFLLASAAETKRAPPPDAAAWRVVVGNLLAGAVAGCAVEGALYPIDTIKTRLQAMIGGGGFKALLAAGGGKGLYAGVWGNLAGVVPSSALFMSVYEPVKQEVYRRTGDDESFWGPVWAGVAAGAAASLTRVPTEVIKQRLQTREFAGAVQALRSIVAKEGLRGLYAGYGAFMLRDLPFDAIEFVAYEQIKQAARRALKRDPNAAEVSLIGAAAGGFTGIVTTPLDVLKTRLMTQGASGRYKNLVDATLQIARTEGAAAFMSGWQPRLIWISLGGFVFFPALEAAKQAFGPAGGLLTPPNTELVIEELEAKDVAAARKRAAAAAKKKE